MKKYLTLFSTYVERERERERERISYKKMEGGNYYLISSLTEREVEGI